MMAGGAPTRRRIGSRAREPFARLRAGRAPADRAAAALTVANLDLPEAAEALSDALGDPAADVRAGAALALASLRDPATIPSLSRIVAGWTDPAFSRSRRAALRTLVAFRSERAALELVDALLAARPGEPLELGDRSALLSVVYAEPAGLAAPAVVRALVSRLGDEDRATADRAATLLALFPAESARPLVRALRRPRPAAARRRAAEALRACRHDDVVSALVAALEDPAAEVRAAAAGSLGDMRDPAAVLALDGAARDGDHRVREAAHSALSALGAVAAASGFAGAAAQE